jgi:dipeptidyl-peptidase-4
VTEAGWWNSAEMDEAATRALVFRSKPDAAGQVYLAGTDGKRIAWIEENALRPGHPYAGHLASHSEPRFGTIPAEDGTPLHYEMLTPKLEPGRRYPVFVEVYGGPGVQRVARDWTSAQAPVSGRPGLDRLHGRQSRRHQPRQEVRGPSLPRYGRRGGARPADRFGLAQAPAVRGWRAGGVYGWSYGGYMVAKLLQARPAPLPPASRARR